MLNDKLKKLIDNSEVVSFDIFDTLIQRMVVNPSDVFDIIEARYNSLHLIHLNSFAKFRIISEKKVRDCSSKEEVALSDIYNVFKELYKKDVDVNELMTLEQEIEVKVCRRRLDTIEVLNYCLEKKKKVVICSDMYLPRETVELILETNNINYDRLFLSSDLFKTKSTGSIFKFMIKEECVDSNKILHIGDNKKSDYLIPKMLGIKTFLVKKSNKKSFSNTMVDYAYSCAGHDMDILKGESYFYKFGYKYLGIVLLNFCRFVDSHIDDRNEIVFLAREGQFIRKCFDIVYENNRCQYMYVSRKSVSASLLSSYDTIEKMIEAQSLSPLETVGMFLSRWDILNDKTIAILSDTGISVDDYIYLDDVKDKLQLVLRDLKECSDVDGKRDIFSEYLKQLHFSDNTSIVDIGWKGTMQDLIQEHLNERNIKINGYYLGVRSLKKSNYKHGFLFNGENDDIEILSRSMTSFLEMLFAADHGTTMGYKMDSEQVVPILADNDISDIELHDIQDVQKGCIDFIKHYKDDNIIFSFDCYKKSYLPLFDFCINPKLKDIEVFDKFCVVDEKEYGLIGNRYGLKYLFHLKKFKDDYILSGWKNAFMKSIFKINLPYSCFFKFAYKRRR